VITARQALLERARVLEAETPVPSPCISICRIDPVRQTCEGCFRTLDEIAAWSRLDDAHKREIWQVIARRAEGAA
jgi:predicted Fe-S protein YdhL (DUF1289 family)